jgi:hypothetical protein
MDKKEWEEIKRQQKINNVDHHMLIHGYLRAIHDYVFHFGLENTAAYLISRCGVDKEALVKCQLETGWEDEKMLALIAKAFATNPQDEQDKWMEEEWVRKNPGPHSRTHWLVMQYKAKAKQPAYDGKHVPKVLFDFDSCMGRAAANKRKRKKI